MTTKRLPKVKMSLTWTDETYYDPDSETLGSRKRMLISAMVGMLLHESAHRTGDELAEWVTSLDGCKLTFVVKEER